MSIAVLHPSKNRNQQAMNIKSKIRENERNPEFIATIIFISMGLLLLVNKAGVLVGQILFRLSGH
jgi:hypothetical protein